MSEGNWGSSGEGGSWGGNGGDSFTEVSSQGWLSRIGNALVGIPIGLILFIGSFVLLFWNEGRSVKTAKTQAEGRSAVVSIDADRVDPALQGKLVHLTGPVTTEGPLKDPLFLVSSEAIRLQRIVSMYQWQEKSETQTRKKLGGGEERTTRYSYTKGWSNHPVDSSRFKNANGHENPSTLPYEPWSADADVVRLGAFRLSPDLVSQINKSEPRPVGDTELNALPPDLKTLLKVDAGKFYVGRDPADPLVGDATIEFRQVRPTTVSLLAQQSGPAHIKVVGKSVLP